MRGPPRSAEAVVPPHVCDLLGRGCGTVGRAVQEQLHVREAPRCICPLKSYPLELVLALVLLFATG